uniref:Uncharacterized protein n=1 Tax=Arundo donax TaxID=35708 RepID=A0A0A9GEF5_ARUDO
MSRRASIFRPWCFHRQSASVKIRGHHQNPSQGRLPPMGLTPKARYWTPPAAIHRRRWMRCETTPLWLREVWC